MRFILENKVVSNAVKALLYELVVNPKPGLVDPTGNETHPDMNVFTFINSSLALEDYFQQVYDAGTNFKKEDLTLLFQEIRPLGQEAEKKMYAVTAGANTHKGVIFSLGVLVAAAGYVGEDVSLIIKVSQKMLANLTKTDFSEIQKKSNLTAGEKQFLNYGLKGIRGEAEAGFPTVTEIALPFFRESKGALNQRLLDTLMKIAGLIDDSTLVKRSGSPKVLFWMRDHIEEFFNRGGSSTEAGFSYLQAFNQEMNQRNLSLGGAADTLIITLFLALLSGELDGTLVS